MSFAIDWLNGVAALVVRATGVLARLGESSYASALASRFSWDFKEATNGEDVREDRPFFVICEHSIRYIWAATDELREHGRIRVYYTDIARYPDDHLASKTDFCNFWYELLTYCAAQQGHTIPDLVTPTSHISIRAIEEVDRPHRVTRRRTHDESDPADYWEAAVDFVFGVNE